ncbi:MAG: tRNA pseudouridine(38-40) synthase TruA [Defluviitaleaceae bacterium]|nr:tRNA pseudouridine(38-40) synthase TruA [Defluviitaleaceae bacterium]
MQTKRIMCIVKYDGSKFFGYQIQPKGRTVQQEIERALKKICKTEITTHAAGRTDSGVHALGQVFHFDSTLEMEASRYKMAFNSILPQDIYIMASKEVDSTWHARFHAISKEYHYRLSTNEYDPLTCDYIYYHRQRLNVEKMKEAMTYFLGRHDFTSFTANMESIDKQRTIYQSEIIVHDEGNYTFRFVGTGFMKYMVRIMVGTLIQVGLSKIYPEEIPLILAAKNRNFAGPTAKSEGLYLHSVEYEVK